MRQRILAKVDTPFLRVGPCVAPTGQRREGFFLWFFGLKGRFYQPRPKAWEPHAANTSALKGPFTF